MKCFVVSILLVLHCQWSHQWYPADCGTSQYPDAGTETPAGVHIVGGVESRPNEFPWTAMLNKQGGFTCGAFVINENWIMTAAHCLDKNSKPEDFTATVRLHDRTDLLQGEEVLFDLIVKHENYDDSTLENDIALLRMAFPFDGPTDFDNTLRPICKPRTNFTYDTTLLVAGWGTTESGGTSPDILRHVNLPIVDNEACAAGYDPVTDPVFDSNICAGEEGRDSCQGDSGSVNAFNNNGVFEAVGIVSWGRGCGDPTATGVLTRITSFLDWIDNVMAANA
ncbi:unnamed protein product [Owenia fusiformis]|uniref:Peptidase S1 domain-containing protein n=1 Tax=Owenia fusiformis TaxID=6347 RepID=A0A8S4P9C6_OWEFU|nr:unnamed protein product [Owenia fusiformis]